MSSSDKQISVAVVVAILIHVAIPLIAWMMTSHFYLLVYLNLTVSSSLLLYWLQKQLRIRQHHVELREMVVLGYEVIIAGCSIYALREGPWHWLRITHLIFSGIHLLGFIAFFIFMLLFRIKKLF